MTTTQPTVLNSMRSTVQVEYSTIEVFDGGGVGNEPPTYDAPGWFAVGGTGARLTSGGSYHFPDVLMELWSAEPPADDSWELSATHEVFLPTATVQLWTPTGRPSPDIFALTPGRQRFSLRASVRGQEAIRAIYTDTSLWPIRDIEHWLLQFW